MACGFLEVTEWFFREWFSPPSPPGGLKKRYGRGVPDYHPPLGVGPEDTTPRSTSDRSKKVFRTEIVDFPFGCFMQKVPKYQLRTLFTTSNLKYITPLSFPPKPLAPGLHASEKRCQQENGSRPLRVFGGPDHHPLSLVRKCVKNRKLFCAVRRLSHFSLDHFTTPAGVSDPLPRQSPAKSPAGTPQGRSHGSLGATQTTPRALPRALSNQCRHTSFLFIVHVFRCISLV